MERSKAKHIKDRHGQIIVDGTHLSRTLDSGHTLIVLDITKVELGLYRGGLQDVTFG